MEKNGVCLSVGAADIGGMVVLNEGFEAWGSVTFLAATVGGAFCSTESKFIGDSETSLEMNRIVIGKDLFLCDGFEASGQIMLAGSQIGGMLGLWNCHLMATPISLQAGGISVAQHVMIKDGFVAEGAVVFAAAQVGGIFTCEKVFDESAGDNPIYPAESLLPSGKIEMKMLILDHARIQTTLKFQVGDSEDLELVSLRDAYAREWDDQWAVGVKRYRWNRWNQRLFEWCSKKSEPPNERAKKYLLSGFTYDSIGEHLGEVAHKDPLAIAHWLYHADECRYDPQPYDQMAKVLETHGYEDAFREVIIAKRIERRRKGQLPAWMSFFDWLLLDVPVRYGYRPWRAIAWGAIICIVAALLFWLGHSAGLMVPADGDVLVNANEKKQEYVMSLPAAGRDEARQAPLMEFLPEGYAQFIPPTYALDLFLPIIDLGQERFWIPDATHSLGLWLWVLKWFVILSGWYLTTLFISSFTGLLRVR